MLIIRLLALFAVLCIGGGMVAWLVSGQKHYQQFAKRSAALFVGLILLFIFLLILERLLGSWLA